MIADLILAALQPAPVPVAECPLTTRASVILAVRYGEMLAVSEMDEATGAVLDLYTNPAAGTWTILARRPDGRSCFVLDGPAKGDPA